MLISIIGIAAGAALGALLGATQSCETGTCPLTSTPYRGAIYGGLVGFLLVSTVSGSSQQLQPLSKEDSTMAVSANGSIVAVVSKEEFQSKVVEADVPVLVDLWAAWCAPCQAQMPIVEDVANRLGDRARVVSINVDEAPGLAQELGVGSIPTLIVFREGQESKRFVGVQSADVLIRALGQ